MYLHHVWQDPKVEVIKFSATIELLGGWDKLKQVVKNQDLNN